MIAFLPLLLLVLTAFTGIFSYSVLAQNRIALRYRLQVCALRAAAARRDLLHRIVHINRTMQPLQKTVYASRTARLAPGAGMAAAITEATALTALRSLKLARETLIMTGASREMLMFRCKTSLHSDAPAFCAFPPVNRTQFRPLPTLFPDVPETVALTRLPPEFRCQGFHHGRLLREGVGLRGSPALLTRDFHHEWKAHE